MIKIVSKKIHQIKKYDNLLIIGSEGFLGTVLVKNLIKKKYFKNIVGVDNCLFGSFNNRYKNFKLLKKNYNNLDKNFLKKFDLIVDLANISNDPSSELNPKFTLINNYLNKKKFFKKLTNVKKYIYASTCSVYGKNKNLVNENSKLSPISVYSKSSLNYEKFIKKNKIPFTILRFGTLFGCSDRMRYDIAINKLIRDAYFGKSIEVLGGEQFRYFCFNETAVEVIENSLLDKKKKFKNKVYNIGNFNIKIIDLAKKIYSYFGDKVKFKHEKFNIDNRSYKVSTKSMNLINKKYLSKNYINNAFSKTVKKIKGDKFPYDKNKVTLNVYAGLLKKR